LIGELSAAAQSVVAVFGERLSVYKVDCVEIWLGAGQQMVCGGGVADRSHSHVCPCQATDVVGVTDDSEVRQQDSLPLVVDGPLTAVIGRPIEQKQL
jgi:hypothetical protein